MYDYVEGRYRMYVVFKFIAVDIWLRIYCNRHLASNLHSFVFSISPSIVVVSLIEEYDVLKFCASLMSKELNIVLSCRGRN